MNTEITPSEEQPIKEEPKRQFDTMGDAMRAGKDDGSSKAREAAPNLKSSVGGAFHDLAYGLAYGAFFTGSFANEMIPRSIKNGLAKGADAGKSAARKARDKAAEVFSPSQDEVVAEIVEEVVINPQTI